MNTLFLGDSITDCGHCFTRDNLGSGYVKYLAEALPSHTLINGGTDGFTFPRIYQKWNTMYRETACDTAVILGGINDVAVLMETELDSMRSAAFLDTSRTALYSLLQGLTAGGTRKIIVIEPFLFEEFGWTASWGAGLERVKGMIRDVFRQCSSQVPDTEFPQMESKCAASSPKTKMYLLSFSEYLNQQRSHTFSGCMNRQHGQTFSDHHNQSHTQAASESQSIYSPHSSDGVHPTEAGHRLLAEMLLEHLLL